MYSLTWRESKANMLSVVSAPMPFGTYHIERGAQEPFNVFFESKKIGSTDTLDLAKKMAVTDLGVRSNDLLNFRTPRGQKELTVAKMRDFLSACEWGDVPDMAHALVGYLVMEQYVLPATNEPPSLKTKRGEQQVASYAAFYGNAGAPTKPGFYWAFWLTATDATVEKEELVPAVKWEIVEVDHNMMGGDPNHPEYWLVAVPGVQAHQYVGNFMWGPRVPDFLPKASDFYNLSGPILDRLLGR